MNILNIGFGSVVCADRIIAVAAPDSAPIKRIITEARDRGALIDATCGKKTRAVIVTDSDHVVLSATEAGTLSARLEALTSNL